MEHQSFTAEQLRVWAHASHEKARLIRASSEEAIFPPVQGYSVNKMTEGGMAQAKKVQLRTEPIEQLGKWHSLMERSEHYQYIKLDRCESVCLSVCV